MSNLGLGLAQLVLWCLTGSIPLFCSLQDDHNQFKAWSGWKIGTWAKFQMTEEKSGKIGHTDLRQVLLDKNSESVWIETAGVTKVDDQVINYGPKKRQIMSTDSFNGGVVQDHGKQTLTTSQKNIECNWVKYQLKVAGEDRITTIWFSDEIPGGVAKQEYRLAGAKMPFMVLLIVSWGD